MKDEQDIINLVEADGWMMDILETAATLNLPDWWVCAGFVRSKIWDMLHGFTERTPLPDIDVIYFDPSSVLEETEKKWQEKLRSIMPDVPWSVKNEARMHTVNNIPPYSSAVDAISKFPETATALGLKLDARHRVILRAPCGIEDVLNMVVRPSPYFLKLGSAQGASIYERRLVTKNWQAIWQRIKVVHAL
ncbi:nucleotidyltransferase family protein [Paenibacillus caui]|uniref:nucleotidyltransferase family protein n=1 Tax=Paenibacillus caui TaxID=2873927 RepID=UPI001CA93573|nr:nucleotidyltransferase family protein [Paenibacillus caui]